MITKVLQKIRYSQRIPCHELYGQHLQCTETSHPIRRDLPPQYHPNQKRGVLCHISETLAVLVLYIPNIIVKYHILNFCNSSRVFLVHEEEEG